MDETWSTLARRLNIKGRYITAMLPLVMVELATTHNLFRYYVDYHEVGWVSILIAIAFPVLLVTGELRLAQEQDGRIRTLLIAGAMILFATQAIANISLAYLHAKSTLGITGISEIWQFVPNQWVHLSSIVFGGVLSVAVVPFWLATAIHIRRDMEQEAFTAAALDDFLGSKRNKR